MFRLPINSTGSRVLDEVAAVIGQASAIALASKFRGQRIYVPKDSCNGQQIVEAIGETAAELLFSHFHGTMLPLPARPAERAQVLALNAEGRLTRQQIAAEVGIGERRVYRILADADNRQGDLFTGR